MTLYKYTAISADGRPLEEEREAGDLAALAVELGRRGLVLVSHARSSRRRASAFSSLRRRAR